MKQGYPSRSLTASSEQSIPSSFTQQMLERAWCDQGCAGQNLSRGELSAILDEALAIVEDTAAFVEASRQQERRRGSTSNNARAA